MNRLENNNSSIIHEGTEIHSNVKIGEFCIIYPNTKIEEDVIIGDFTIIGKPPLAGTNQMKLSDVQNNTIIEKGTIIGDYVKIYAGSLIGMNCYIADKALIRENVKLCNEVVIGTGVTVSFGAQVGWKSKIMTGSNISGNMIIGDQCFLGVLVCAVNDNNPTISKPRAELIGARIGDRVVIGSNSTILPRVVIEEDITVGASSLVSKSLFEKNALYMGTPAKFIKLKL